MIVSTEEVVIVTGTVLIMVSSEKVVMTTGTVSTAVVVITLPVQFSGIW